MVLLILANTSVQLQPVGKPLTESYTVRRYMKAGYTQKHLLIDTGSPARLPEPELINVTNYYDNQNDTFLNENKYFSDNF